MKTNKPLTASSPSNSDGGFTSIRVLKAIVAVLLVAAIPFVLLRASEQQTYDASFDGTNADLIGWWRFDETSGSTVEDYSGNGNSAEIRTTQHVTRVPFTSCASAPAAARAQTARRAAALRTGGIPTPLCRALDATAARLD